METITTARQPVIILGMHRSGTSMVSEVLDKQGLFVGATLQDDHESTYFLDLNEQMMARVNCVWDQPVPMREFLATDDAVRMTATALAADLNNHRRAKPFFGGKTFGGDDFKTFDKPWGWKDPRTVFTLPVWLKLFPQAKLLYIVRNGVDVAKSLMVRERKLLKLRVERFESRLEKRGLRSCLDRAGYKGSARCLTLAGGFGLWSEYVQQADDVLRDLPNPLLTIRYEDILADPRKQLAAMAEFSGLTVDPATVEKIVPTIDGSRALAFNSDPTTATFFQSIKADPWMIKFGYGA